MGQESPFNNHGVLHCSPATWRPHDIGMGSSELGIGEWPSRRTIGSSQSGQFPKSSGGFGFHGGDERVLACRFHT
jgi:hypothetical protein